MIAFRLQYLQLSLPNHKASIITQFIAPLGMGWGRYWLTEEGRNHGGCHGGIHWGHMFNICTSNSRQTYTKYNMLCVIT